MTGKGYETGRGATAGAATVAILGYHKIGPPPPRGWDTWYYVPEATFAAHLAHLRGSGWEAVGLDLFLAGLDDPKVLPARSALITFDDGYRSTLTVAAPWLKRFGHPGVMFVPTAFIGACNRFDEAEPEEPICDWDDLRELESIGVSIQSHGVGHRGLSALRPDELREELVRSRAVLEERLPRPVEVFAYPYGDGGADPGVVGESLRQAGYRAALLYGGGPNRLPAADPYRLTRLAMGPDTDLGEALAIPQKEGP